jgi:hypothetical protein
MHSVQHQLFLSKLPTLTTDLQHAWGPWHLCGKEPWVGPGVWLACACDRIDPFSVPWPTLARRGGVVAAYTVGSLCQLFLSQLDGLAGPQERRSGGLALGCGQRVHLVPFVHPEMWSPPTLRPRVSAQRVHGGVGVWSMGGLDAMGRRSTRASSHPTVASATILPFSRYCDRPSPIRCASIGGRRGGSGYGDCMPLSTAHADGPAGGVGEPLLVLGGRLAARPAVGFGCGWCGCFESSVSLVGPRPPCLAVGLCGCLWV